MTNARRTAELPWLPATAAAAMLAAAVAGLPAQTNVQPATVRNRNGNNQTNTSGNSIKQAASDGGQQPAPSSTGSGQSRVTGPTSGFSNSKSSGPGSPPIGGMRRAEPANAFTPVAGAAGADVGNAPRRPTTQPTNVLATPFVYATPFPYAYPTLTPGYMLVPIPSGQRTPFPFVTATPTPAVIGRPGAAVTPFVTPTFTPTGYYPGGGYVPLPNGTLGTPFPFVTATPTPAVIGRPGAAVTPFVTPVVTPGGFYPPGGYIPLPNGTLGTLTPAPATIVTPAAKI